MVSTGKGRLTWLYNAIRTCLMHEPLKSPGIPASNGGRICQKYAMTPGVALSLLKRTKWWYAEFSALVRVINGPNFEQIF